MKRIVLLAYDYPPNNGGISRLCGDIISELKYRGIPYLVITPADDSDGVIDDQNIIRINEKRGKLEFEILKILKSKITKEDIILCDTWHPAGLLCKLANKKYYILAHGAELLPGVGFVRSKVWPAIRQMVLNGSEGVIANSHYTANLVKQNTTRPKVYALPLPVNSNLFYPTKTKNDDNVLRICSISRIEKFKAHDFLIKTISLLEPKYKERLRLTIGGKGPYLETLRKLTDELNLNTIVNFVGFVDAEEMNNFYSSHDLFILCTREEPQFRNVEGFGLVFVEAQACGTAVIGTRAGGIPDAVKENKGGWLIPQDNVDELLSILKSSIDAKEEVHRQGVLARQRVIKECNIGKYIDGLLSRINY